MSILSDEFYYQHINLDTVNTQVFTNLTSKVGDTNGRGLIVTLTENGLQKDTTGISLNLKWKHRSIVVALYTSAWIEITCAGIDQTGCQSRTLHECVD